MVGDGCATGECGSELVKIKEKVTTMYSYDYKADSMGNVTVTRSDGCSIYLQGDSALAFQPPIAETWLAEGVTVEEAQQSYMAEYFTPGAAVQEDGVEGFLDDGGDFRPLSESPLLDEAYNALKRCVPWLGLLIAEGGHLKSAMPNDAVQALAMARAVVKKLEGAGDSNAVAELITAAEAAKDLLKELQEGGAENPELQMLTKALEKVEVK